MKNSNISFLLSFFLLLALSCGKTDDPQPLKSKEKQVVSFKVTINAQEIISTITEADKKISLSLPYNSDVKVLAPIITISDKATVSPSSGVAQDFTNPVKYKVTAEDGTIAEYTITISVTQPTKCLLIKESTNEAESIYEATYSYAADKIIETSSKFTKNGVTTTGTRTNTYDQKGNKIKSESIDSYLLYTYNSNNKLTKQEEFKKTDNSLNGRTEFEYNSNGQLIKVQTYLLSSGILIKYVYLTFEYPTTSTKNHSKLKVFDYISNDLLSVVEYEYDDKKNPFKDDSLEIDNNVTKTTSTRLGDNPSVSIELLTYEYNTLGFPTKKVRSNGGVNSTTTYTYDCK